MFWPYLRLKVAYNVPSSRLFVITWRVIFCKLRVRLLWIEGWKGANVGSSLVFCWNWFDIDGRMWSLSRRLLGHWLAQFVKSTVSLLFSWWLYGQKTSQVLDFVRSKLGREWVFQVLRSHTRRAFERGVWHKSSLNGASLLGELIQVGLDDFAFLIDGQYVLPGQWFFAHRKVIFMHLFIQIPLIIAWWVSFLFRRRYFQGFFGQGHQAELLRSGCMVTIIDNNIGLLFEFVLVIDEFLFKNLLGLWFLLDRSAHLLYLFQKIWAIVSRSGEIVLGIKNCIRSFIFCFSHENLS